ncbi:MAG: fatty acid cis/trans isomerase [Thermodesulfobacteriota bacterium]
MPKHLLLIVLITLSACAQKPPQPVAVNPPSRSIHYLSEVKPILDNRCAVCHSCYNSPCQLKLNSYEGVDRGGTKEPVYNATRLSTMDPTRLFIDAENTGQWREKGFHSVTESTAADGFNNSVMLEFLDHKMKNPVSSGNYYSEADDLTCSQSRIELEGYLAKHPNRGMPFGFPPLSKEEFDIIAGWLAQGAAGPSSAEHEELRRPAPQDLAAIDQWETFLNTDDAKHAITARYLYEHLFLAHIRFSKDSSNDYELVRSTTPPGQKVDLINSVRPYDDPETDKFYYRFRKIHATIVHKTHMVFFFDDSQFQRIRELFIEPDWITEPHRIGFDKTLSANPFAAFEQIPPRSRYQFLLDNIHYIIMTFIRGPVCRGQVALNVIHDHFWVMFKDPDHDLSVQHPGFLKLHLDKLVMPIERGSQLPIKDLLTNKYQEAVKEFYKVRQEAYYANHHYEGQGIDSIWKGNRAGDSPLLTVYRHFDSASVHQGPLGPLPRTLWVLDYPLIERIYYALVAGFDVYGTASHQLAVRLYMNNLRVEGESYFLNLLPEERRREIMRSWYRGIDFEGVGYIDAHMVPALDFKSSDPKRELVEHLVDDHFPPEMKISFDPINYLRADEHYPSLPQTYSRLEDYLRGFRAVSRTGTPFFQYVNDYNANLAYVRIRRNNGKDVVISAIINRWHDNVMFLFKENSTLSHNRDRADFIMGFHGSYPNFLFDLRQDDLPDFFRILASEKLTDEDRSRLKKYGVNRADKDFWQVFDWFQQRFYKEQPIRAGLFDLNRYYYKAESD